MNYVIIFLLLLLYMHSTFILLIYKNFMLLEVCIFFCAQEIHDFYKLIIHINFELHNTTFLFKTVENYLKCHPPFL